jgi:putative exporter of polyketide antibiotics
MILRAQEESGVRHPDSQPPSGSSTGIRKERNEMINKIVLSMAGLRLLSGSIEIIAALIMLRLNQIDKALLVNSGLAMVGPLVLLTTTTIGLVGIAEKLSFGKMLWVLLGVSFIFIGILKK